MTVYCVLQCTHLRVHKEMHEKWIFFLNSTKIHTHIFTERNPMNYGWNLSKWHENKIQFTLTNKYKSIENSMGFRSLRNLLHYTKWNRINFVLFFCEHLTINMPWIWNMFVCKKNQMHFARRELNFINAQPVVMNTFDTCLHHFTNTTRNSILFTHFSLFLHTIITKLEYQ